MTKWLCCNRSRILSLANKQESCMMDELAALRKELESSQDELQLKMQDMPQQLHEPGES